MSGTRGSQNIYLLVPMLLIAVLLGIAVVRGPHLVSYSGFGSAIIVAAPLMLATYALMALAIAGRGTVDLAVGPLLAFINVSVVKLNMLGIITSPFAVFAVALGIGVAYQLLFVLMILWVRVQPIIVALSGFLALTGINLVILPRPGGTAPDWMASWGLGTSIFSPILAILIIATGGWLLFTLSSFYGNLRMMGYDERAAYTSGVRIEIVRVGAHVIAGLFVGLAAICYTALIASGDPTQGTTMSLTAVTAVVLGGVSLAGGRGGVIGAALGAINLFLIGYVLATFNFGSVQAFVTQLFYGLILILSLLLTLLVPIIGRYLYFITPYSAFVVLGCIVAGIMLKMSAEDARQAAVVMAAPGPDSALTSRYLLLPAAAAGDGLVHVSMTALQKQLLGFGAALALLVFTLRMTVAEAISVRFGVFMYVFVSSLILMLLFVAGDLSLAGVRP